jgi:hypothetical protein
MSSIYKKPFRYDRKVQRIVDAAGNELCMMRGWSFLRSQLDTNEALEVQDHWGELLTFVINNHIDINDKESNPLTE